MIEPLPINPTPKLQFQQSSDNIAKHKRLLEMTELERGINFALLQMQADLADRPTDGNAAAANWFRIMGANDFIKTFRELAQSPTPLASKRDNGQLIQVLK